MQTKEEVDAALEQLHEQLKARTSYESRYNTEDSFYDFHLEEEEGGMRSVKVKREELLKKVEDNRNKHREVFLDACEGYQKKVIEVLEQRLAQARRKERVDTLIHLIQPMDQTKEYDRVIQMLKMSTDEVIELTQQEFAQYVMDDWGWKDQFIGSTSMYNSPKYK